MYRTNAGLFARFYNCFLPAIARVEVMVCSRGDLANLTLWMPATARTRLDVVAQVVLQTMIIVIITAITDFDVGVVVGSWRVPLNVIA